MATLHTWEFGPRDGSAVLCIHGVMGHGRRFSRFSAALPGRRLLAVDLRGHGQSLRTPPWNTEQHVADLLETMDAWDVERFAVVGHSFGGHLALHLAATAPERVERVALLDPATQMDGDDMQQRAEDMHEDESWASPEEFVAEMMDGRPEAVRPFVEAEVGFHLEQGPDGRLRRRYLSSTVITAWGEMARPQARVPADLPVLLLPARDEEFVRDVNVETLRTDVGRHLEVREVPAGHMVYWEQFDFVTEALDAFLEGRRA